MTPADLASAVLAAARDVFDGRGLDPTLVPASTGVERPRNPEHGDYASTIALQLAKPAGLAPRELAEAIAARLRPAAGIGSVDVAGPGFLNIRLDAAATGDLARVVAERGPAYGCGRGLTGQRLNLEFVSANPTGPLHTGAVRWAAAGDALARLLRASGAEVTTEYYFNDAGAQIDRFASSLLATARGEPIPEDGYAGPYIADLAAAVVAKHPDAAGRADAEAREIFRVEGVALMFDEIKTSLAAFGVHFDVYFNEKDLHQRGELDAALARLREQGHVYESGGAIWLRTTDFDDDRDRVLVRSTGAPTYFLADCAYYLDKRERGFDRVVIMLGADHHGYIGRMRAMAACFGDDPDRTLEILIGQMVNLVREGQPVRMSKRAGTYVTLEDLVEAMGIDASRYALARYSFNSPIDLDLDLWTRAAPENPVYYVQYAHARISSMQRHAEELGISRGDDFDPGLLTHEREGDLLRTLGEFPAVVATAAELREPHRVARYLEELAGVLHKFYDTEACRVLPRAQPAQPATAREHRGEARSGPSAQPAQPAQLAQPTQPSSELTQARLWLVEAARIVFVNGLGLLGVTAPDRM